MDKDQLSPAENNSLAGEPVVEDATRKAEDTPNLADTIEYEKATEAIESVEDARNQQAYAEQSVRAEQIIVELNEVTQRFRMHTPTQQQIVLMEDLAKTYAYLAKMILAVCPRCADRTHAIRQLQDSKMWANTAIMLEGKI